MVMFLTPPVYWNVWPLLNDPRALKIPEWLLTFLCWLFSTTFICSININWMNNMSQALYFCVLKTEKWTKQTKLLPFHLSGMWKKITEKVKYWDGRWQKGLQEKKHKGGRRVKVEWGNFATLDWVAKESLSKIKIQNWWRNEPWKSVTGRENS